MRFLLLSGKPLFREKKEKKALDVLCFTNFFFIKDGPFAYWILTVQAMR